MPADKSGARRPRARTGRARQIGLLISGLLLAGLLGEGLLRLLGYYGEREAPVEPIRPVEDPVVDFRRVPGTSWIYDNLRYDINQHGWRDYDYAYEKPPGTFRIVVLGDSVTNGHGVDLEDIYAKRLERLLNAGSAPPARFEVLLLTIGALNTEQEVHLLEVEGLRYDPDLVILGYVLNDPERRASLKRQMEAAKRESRLDRLKRRARRSSLAHLAYRSGQRLLWRLRRAAGREEVAGYVARDYFTALHADPERWATVVAALERLGRLTAERGTPVVVTIFPVLYDLDDYPWIEIHDRVGSTARGLGFDVVDLLPVFRSRPAAALQVREGDHVHPNALGHRLAAEALHSFLVERGLPTVR